MFSGLRSVCTHLSKQHDFNHNNYLFEPIGERSLYLLVYRLWRYGKLYRGNSVTISGVTVNYNYNYIYMKLISLVLLATLLNSTAVYAQRQAAVDSEKAAYFRLLSMSEGGNHHAQFSLGAMYFNGIGVAQDREVAITWWTKSAKQGNAYAQAKIDQLTNN